MLPAAYRLTRRQDFTVVVRRGRRAGRRRLVVHALIDSDLGRDPVSPQHATRPGDDPAVTGAAGTLSDGMTPTPTRDAARPPRVGFVVSKAVGGSVVRHQVTRRLRHLMRDRLAGLPAGSGVVVRALGPAATASSSELGADLDAALRRLTGHPPAADRPVAGASR